MFATEVRRLSPDQVLAFTRRFAAPRDLVWRLWRHPEHMVRWHGPEGFWLTHCEIDFRVGGKWRRCMSRAAGHEHWIHGEYLEIHEPERLVFSYINDFDGIEMVVRLDFEDIGGATLMRFEQAPFVSLAERDGHGWGWQSGFDLFAAYAERLLASGGTAPVGRPRIENAEQIAASGHQRED